MAELQVRIVAVDHEVWSGEASIVVAKTVEGEIGILPGHEPVLGLLVDGAVRLKPLEGEEIVAAVHGGFLSVEKNVVSVLAETAELATEIDVARAQEFLDRLKAEPESTPEVEAAIRRQESRLKIAVHPTPHGH
jgi:F-type H+-transporting ATPase subunit epsilon